MKSSVLNTGVSIIAGRTGNILYLFCRHNGITETRSYPYSPKRQQG